MEPEDRTGTRWGQSQDGERSGACLEADGLYVATRTDQLLAHVLLAAEGLAVAPCDGGDTEHRRAHGNYHAGCATRTGRTSSWGRWLASLEPGELDSLAAVLVAWDDAAATLAGTYPGMEDKARGAVLDRRLAGRLERVRLLQPDDLCATELADALEAGRRCDAEVVAEVYDGAAQRGAEELVMLYRSTFAAAQGSGSVVQAKLLWLVARRTRPAGDHVWSQATSLLDKVVPPPRHLGIPPEVVRGERDRWWGAYRDAVERRPSALLAAHGATVQLDGAAAFGHAERSAYYRALGRPERHGGTSQRPAVRPTGLDEILADAYQGASGWWADQLAALADGSDRRGKE